METSLHQNIWVESNKKWALERKPWKKNKLFHWKACNVFCKILYCIRKYFIMWMSNLIVLRGDQEMIWKVCVCDRQKYIYIYIYIYIYSIFYTNNSSNIRTYTVLNTLSGDFKFAISVLRYCIAKDFPKKIMHTITTYKWPRYSRPK